MDFAHLHRRFRAIGAYLHIEHDWPRPSWREDYSLDIIEQDRRRESFLVRLARDRVRDLELTVPALDVRRRHLLLQARRVEGVRQFLCGHDERHWFIAELPRNVTGLDDAFAALRPARLQSQNGRKRGAGKGRHRWRRQGEWFFLPAPWLDGRHDLIYHRNEPLRRGEGKPHVAERLHRVGGQESWFDPVTGESYTRFEMEQIERRLWHAWWSAKGAEALRVTRMAYRGLGYRRHKLQVFVQGRITHPDHATVVLPGWHRALPNAEPSRADGAAGPLAFLD